FSPTVFVTIAILKWREHGGWGRIQGQYLSGSVSAQALRQQHGRTPAVVFTSHETNRRGNQMRHLFGAVAASLTFLALPAIAADSNAPAFENGPVWDFAQIKTKDGHFDDYMHWLATDWKSQEDALKKAGVIMDYKVYLV